MYSTRASSLHRLERRVGRLLLEPRLPVIGFLGAVRTLDVVRIAPVEDRVDELRRHVRLRAADVLDESLEQRVGRGIDVDLRGLVHRGGDDVDLAFAPAPRLAVGCPRGRIARTGQLERHALDRAIGRGARLRERQRIARGDGLAVHREREAAGDHREHDREPQHDDERDAALRKRGAAGIPSRSHALHADGVPRAAARFRRGAR